MTKSDRRKIAQETIRITKQRFYRKNGRKIELKPESCYGYEDVFVLSPGRLDQIEEDEEGYFTDCLNASESCGIYLVDADSFEASQGQTHPLVMNFANAIHPGGGFLNGAIAQEECLCRNSTLYASISSEEAAEMYSFNALEQSAVDSDYMLLSPSVCVFRDTEMELLDRPYHVAVMTIAAPNKRGRAASVPQKQLDEVMTNRLRGFLHAVARYGYRTLVLGAWGCGAFGHDTRRVAGYYYRLLIDEGFEKFFDTVIFAIYKDPDKIDAFAEVFGDKIENCVVEEVQEQAGGEYREAHMPFPVCNHIIDVDESNIGYTQGIFADGTPFESELWMQNGELNMTTFIPRIQELEAAERMADVCVIQSEPCDDEVEFELLVDDSALTVGMELVSEITDTPVIDAYAEFLIQNNALRYSTPVRNGSCAVFKDAEGNQLIRITVCLESQGRRLAETSLHYRSFPNTPERWIFTVRL